MEPLFEGLVHSGDLIVVRQHLLQQFPVSPGQFAIFPFLMKSRAIFRDLASDDVNSWSEFACLTRLFHLY
jgi:hypothetical protein